MLSTERQDAKRTRIRSRYVNPRDLKASELKVLVAILKHGERVPNSDGLVFTRTLVFRYTVACKLGRMGLLEKYTDGIELSRAGEGIARIFADRPILGYD